MVKKLLNWTWKFIVSVSVIIGLIAAWNELFSNEDIQIEIKNISSVELTKAPTDKNISVSYLFSDSIPIENFWKFNFKIYNSGNTTVIGSGNQSSIINDALPLSINDQLSIVSIAVTNANFPVKLRTGKSYELSFEQWKPSEFLEMEIYAEMPSSIEIKKILTINEREIINGKIDYSQYDLKDSPENLKLIDKLPNNLQFIIKWLIVITIIIMTILTAVGIRKEFKKNQEWNVGTKFFTLVFVMLITAVFATPLLWIF